MKLIDADALAAKYMSVPPDYYHTAQIVGEITSAPTVKTQGWISVKDAMPKTGNVYLITLNPPATMPQTMEAYLRHDGTWWRGSVSLISEYVTHWMPLPEPPKENNS